MKKILAVLIVLALPLAVQAAAGTYSATDNGVKVVCASGTCDAPSEAASLDDGWPLVSSGGLWKNNSVIITVCADSGQTLSGAGTLTAYYRDPSVALWSTVTSLNFSVTSSARRCQSFFGGAILLAVGRATWVPTGVTVSAGGTTVYISGK